MIRFTCPQCKATLKAAEERRGAKAKCGKCKQTVRVPSTPTQGVTVLSGEDDFDFSSSLPVRKARPVRAPLFRSPVAVVGVCIGACLVALLALGGVAVYAFRNEEKPAPLAQVTDKESVPPVPEKGRPTEEKRPERATPREEPKNQPTPPVAPAPEPEPNPVEKSPGPETDVAKPTAPESPPEKPTQPAPNPDKDPPPGPEPKPKVVAKEKPLSKKVQAGLDYLARVQMKNGAWAEGSEEENPNNPDSKLPSVAHTSLAGLTFLRAGGSPSNGAHAKRLTLAVEFVCAAVEKADKESLTLGDGINTYIRTKLGQYIDTYLALWFLAEVKGQMTDDKANERVEKALAKVIDKMQRHQLADGSWDSIGVSPGVANGIATKGMFRARQVGADVDKAVLAKAEKRGREYFDKVKPGNGTGLIMLTPPGKGGDSKPGSKDKPPPGVGTGPGPDLDALLDPSLGFDLYSLTSNLSAIQEAVSTTRQAEAVARRIAESPSATESEKATAKELAESATRAEKVHKEAIDKLAKYLGSEDLLMSLEGCGGEEFFGLVIVSESLQAGGSKDWNKWDKFVTNGLNKSQNRDGSWSGGHCLTGRVFCTAAALLALTSDRAPLVNAAR
jgi:hypothetical protein